MIDISEKQTSARTATAEGVIKVTPATIERVLKDDLPKGNLFDIARAAAYLGAKKTADLIPHCHPLFIEELDVKFEVDREKSEISCNVLARTTYKTGIEMEAMTAVSVGLLTVYDLLKPIEKEMEIGAIRLVKKTGGRSQQKKEMEKNSEKLTAAVLVVSDSTARGERKDKSGVIIKEMLESHGVEIKDYAIVPDEPEQIRAKVQGWVDQDIAFIITTGGTGLGPRDLTIEALEGVLEKEVPGIAEAMRSYGIDKTPKAMLSRSLAGSVKESLVLALPGSSKGAKESLSAILPGVFHARLMLKGGGHQG